MSKVYLVYMEYGEYDDYTYKPVAIYKTRERAEQICAEREIEIDKKLKSESRCNRCNFAYCKTAELEQAKRIPKCYKEGERTGSVVSGVCCSSFGCLTSAPTCYAIPAMVKCANVHYTHFNDDELESYKIKELKGE